MYYSEKVARIILIKRVNVFKSEGDLEKKIIIIIVNNQTNNTNCNCLSEKVICV